MNEVVTRIISASILGAFYFFVVIYGGLHRILLLLFLIFFTGLALFEFYRIATAKIKTEFSVGFIYLASLFLLFGTYFEMNKAEFLPLFEKWWGESLIFMKFLSFDFSKMTAIVFFLLVILFLNILGKKKTEGVLFSVGLGMVGFLYITLPFTHLVLLVYLPDGVFLAMFASLATMATDVMGYAAGKIFGRHKIGFSISPNKTWEGYLGAIFGQMIFTFSFYSSLKIVLPLPIVSLGMLIFLSLFISFFSILGDLAESALKRDVILKDAGGIIPGHGGVLDRVDSLLFSIPSFYYLTLCINIFK